MRRWFIKYWLVALGFLIISVNVSAPLAAETLEIKTLDKAPPSQAIMYSIRPLALIGREVVGDYAKHLTLLPPGVTPHDYVLKISDIGRLKQAEVIVWMGPDIEPYLSKIISRLVANRKQIKVINVSDVNQVPGIKLFAIKKTIDHQHEGDGTSDLSPASYDPHLWLSPANARVIADALTKKIEYIDPGSQKEMESKLKSFSEKMNFISNKGSGLNYKPYVVYHNAFMYLENYLKIKNSGAITDNHHSKAGLRHIVNMAEKINSENIACMISPLNFDEKLVKKVFGENQFYLIRFDLMADESKENAIYSDYLTLFIQDLKACIEYQ